MKEEEEAASDQRFKIEQFLIMPALLVIRDTGDTGVPTADGTSLLPSLK